MWHFHFACARRCSVAGQSNRDCKDCQSDREQPTPTVTCARWNCSHCEAAKFGN